MDEDGDLQADPFTSLEYTSLENAVNMDILSQQIQAQTSIDNELIEDDFENLSGVEQEVNAAVNGHNETAIIPDNLRGINEDTLLHSESISYDVLCAMAGTSNLGSIRNFTIRLRSVVIS